MAQSRALSQLRPPPSPSPDAAAEDLRPPVVSPFAADDVHAIPLATLQMAPDRGTRPEPAQSPPPNNLNPQSPTPAYRDDADDDDAELQQDPARVRSILAQRAAEPQNFTLRGILVGLAIGIVICFSNTYFGLQTGWVSSMAMPSALLGFAWFRLMSRHLRLPFSPVENVLIQSVAGSVGTMPLGCGFVGVIPALQYLLKPEENGPLDVGLWKLIVWAVGICFFGVVFAVPLRRQVIIREKLKFPSGTAAALMIGVLHGQYGKGQVIRQDDHRDTQERDGDDGERSHLLVGRADSPPPQTFPETDAENEAGTGLDAQSDWKAKVRLLTIAFGVSAVYTVFTYFVPQLRDVPIFGLHLAHNWLWTLNPSPAYIGQGIIMGPETTLHMLLGAILGWGLLSPLAKNKGWAPGPVSDWETGSKGWIVWVSLAIMLADSLVSLGWLILRPLVNYARVWLPRLTDHFRQRTWSDIFSFDVHSLKSLNGYTAIDGTQTLKRDPSDEEEDAPPEHLISTRTTLIGLVLSLGLSIGAVHYVFGNLVPLSLNILGLFLALMLSIMGVRALGETDLNPVSGISKLTQLLIALAIPNAATNKNAVVINLVAGALSESGALQAGDLMQDIKTGHLLGAAPNAQFWGQMIGSGVGAVLSAVIYRLYTNVYEVPGKLFEVPTGFVWIFTARLVTGKGLPPMVMQWALGAGLVFAVGTAIRVGEQTKAGTRRWTRFVPGGIAVAVGMYNTPSFTLARTIGGLMNLYWLRYRGKQETPLIVLASGLILGEGLLSIVNLLLASLAVPHL
ncbi:oligopeptide transporter [Diplodia corticola]|uniref:Oligopeptide transporter n=1 Tax=Diplodia corticola TaxID=236234 RepID=A0A1J9S3J3_9PEZI|nr:oligopeptide transporter [Diplodia corticola]OJD34197.1 oligopeptide transporter [Diplodia corticola]